MIQTISRSNFQFDIFNLLFFRKAALTGLPVEIIKGSETPVVGTILLKEFLCFRAMSVSNRKSKMSNDDDNEILTSAVYP